MKEDLYVRLGNRLNQNDFQIPLIKETLEFLKEVFSEEQAELGAEFPLGAHTSKSLAGILTRDENELERLLEGMADEGLIFIARSDSGEKEYSLPPFAPGILEFQTLKGEDNDKVRKRSHMITAMMNALDVLLEQKIRNTDPAQPAPVPGLRTIAVESHLPVDTTAIATWEQLTEIINREESFAAGACHCREHARFNGRPCSLDIPQDSCIYFGKIADFMVERQFARRYSREGILDLLKACEKAGAIHNINNTIGDNIVLCNCCGCCCGFIGRMKKHRGLKSIQGSNFVATIDTTSCIGCGQCIDLCPIGALEMKEDVACVTPDYCLGCGNCVAQCPVGSITLSRCSEYCPNEKSPLIVGLGR